MDSVNVITPNAGGGIPPVKKVQETAEGHEDKQSFSDEMKGIRKQRLQRQVFEDPSMAGKLVATEASPVYNAKGELIQAVTGSGA